MHNKYITDSLTSLIVFFIWEVSKSLPKAQLSLTLPQSFSDMNTLHHNNLSITKTNHIHGNTKTNNQKSINIKLNINQSCTFVIDIHPILTKEYENIFNCPLIWDKQMNWKRNDRVEKHWNKEKWSISAIFFRCWQLWMNLHHWISLGTLTLSKFTNTFQTLLWDSSTWSRYSLFHTYFTTYSVKHWRMPSRISSFIHKGTNSLAITIGITGQWVSTNTNSHFFHPVGHVVERLECKELQWWKQNHCKLVPKCRIWQASWNTCTLWEKLIRLVPWPY